MTGTLNEKQFVPATQFVLHAHRSLSPRGFLIFMTVVSTISFIAGLAFWMMGAWPVMGFFGLDVALIYFAFKLNYRSGLAYETIDLTPQLLTLTRVKPTGATEAVELNPHWARVSVTTDRPDGRTSMRLIAQGREILFGQFLTDDERRSFANALSGALVAARTAQF